MNADMFVIIDQVRKLRGAIMTRAAALGRLVSDLGSRIEIAEKEHNIGHAQYYF